MINTKLNVYLVYLVSCLVEFYLVISMSSYHWSQNPKIVLNWYKFCNNVAEDSLLELHRRKLITWFLLPAEVKQDYRGDHNKKIKLTNTFGSTLFRTSSRHLPYSLKKNSNTFSTWLYKHFALFREWYKMFFIYLQLYYICI